MSFSWRALFPSWAFFIKPGPPIQLQYLENKDWKNAIAPIPRSLTRILFNPEAGYRHAARNAVEQLLIEVSENPNPSVIPNLDSYLIVKRLVTSIAGHETAFRIQAAGETVFQSGEA